ncbi:MAG: hypothetical protein HKM07_05965 [Chlamydiae bacterium]|nr:hypothetical protein [Chlamydiota bacterium]
MKKEVREIFSQTSLQAGCEKAWAIFLGIGKSFVLHLSPDFGTSEVYNTVDEDPDHPMLGMGERFSCSQKLMDALKAYLPAHHAELPPQVTFAIVPKGSSEGPSVGGKSFDELQNGICDLLERRIDAIITAKYKITLLEPSGTKSLSFKKTDFPIQIWTHLNRVEALRGSLQVDERDLPKFAFGKTRETLEDRITVLKNAQHQETEIGKLQREIEASQKSILEKTGKIEKVGKDKQALVDNMRIPQLQKTNAIAAKEREITKLEEEKKSFEDGLPGLLATLAQKEQELARFKDENASFLPTSYLLPTFQIGVEFTDSAGSSVYKRYSAGGHILTGDSDIAYRNDVHLAYKGINF